MLYIALHWSSTLPLLCWTLSVRPAQPPSCRKFLLQRNAIVQTTHCALHWSTLLFTGPPLLYFAQHCQPAWRSPSLAENAPRRSSQDIGTPSFDDDHDDDQDDNDDDDSDEASHRILAPGTKFSYQGRYILLRTVAHFHKFNKGLFPSKRTGVFSDNLGCVE